MAFGFFRRNQKMVMIIMVILMVTFLISFQGIEPFFRSSGGKSVVGASRYGNITSNDLMTARNDLRMLSNVRGLAVDRKFRAYLSQEAKPTDPFMVFGELADSADPALTFACLLQEANNRNIKISDQEVDAALDQMGYAVSGPAYKELIAGLKADKAGNEGLFRQAVRNWLAVYQGALTAVADIPPSDAELRMIYRDITERIKLDVAAISADDLAKTIELSPTDQQIEEQFRTYANVPPGPKALGDMGFGYRLPNRAAVAYIYASRAVLARVAEPTEAQLLQYWRSHQDEMVEVEEAAASKPTTASAPVGNDSSDQPTTVRRRLGDLSKAQAQKAIIKLQSDQAVASRMDELFSAIEGLEQELAASSGDTLYKDIVERMTIPADQALKTPLKTQIVNASLSDALAVMAKDLQDAGVSVRLICFPMGKHGNVTIDPSVKVNLDIAGKKMTLADALKQLTADLGLKIDGWATCQKMEDVLFPLPGDQEQYDFFPITARRTALLSATELADDPLLGHSFSSPTGDRGSLSEFISQCELFNPSGKGSKMKIGQKGPLMYVMADHAGRLIWRLTDARLSEQPTEMTPAIREQVVKDLKIQAAWNQAAEQAKQLQAAAKDGNLAKAAEAAKLKVQEVELTRKIYIREYDMFFPSMIPSLGIPRQFSQNFIDAAFRLAPANVEPTTQGYGSSEASILQMPAMHEVMLMQRTGFTPSVEPDYERDRPWLSDMMIDARRRGSLQQWFNMDNIAARIDYKPAVEQ